MYSLAIHGGAGTILRETMTPELEAQYTSALKAALGAGLRILEKGGAALDAVSAAVVSLEDCPLFNAGRGAVFNHEGGHELDASIMEGAGLNAGAIAGVTGVRNPVLLARAVMEHSRHVLLCGPGAMEFAKATGAAMEPAEYFHTDLRHAQWQEALKAGRIQLDHAAAPRKHGTVGAVAKDVRGNLAAATSTGGLTNKQWGRAGDTPIPGAGTWADNQTCAISCTGEGEYFIRAVVAHDVHCLMAYRGMTLEEAARVVVQDKLVRMGGEGGLIGVDKDGGVALVFNTEGMYRAAADSTGMEVVGIYEHTQ